MLDLIGPPKKEGPESLSERLGEIIGRRVDPHPKLQTPVRRQGPTPVLHQPAGRYRNFGAQ